MSEAAYCPFKGRCEHPDCLIDIDQCASALVASARVTTPPTATSDPAGTSEQEASS